ncbi:MAG: hypothetical protein HY557_04560 [Euryarchaeota archaeon]|nr:hypothetical protein [Euryarchaeota archaeon]
MFGGMRFLALFVVTFFTVLAFAPAVRADMGKPSWSIGDYWEYTTTLAAPGGPVQGTGKFRLDVVGTDSVTVGAATYSTFRGRLAINVTSGSVTYNLPGEAWFRESDLAVVKIQITVEAFGQSATSTITFDPPQGIQWPLSAGSTWSATSSVTVSVTGGQPVTAPSSSEFRVESNTQVTVPAGTFDTTPLRASDASGEGGYTVSHFSPAAGNAVRAQTFDNQDQEQGTIELAKYNYRAASYILGLPIWLWLVLLLVVVVAIIAVAIWRRKPAQPMMPPSSPPSQQAGWPPQAEGPPPPPPPQQFQPPRGPPPTQP